MNENIMPSNYSDSPLGACIDEHLYKTQNIVGNYRIVKSLGVGSSCDVKLGINPENNLRVAIKIIERSSLQEERVYREALIASLLCHPHIVCLKDFFYSPSFFFLAFEHVPGVQLLDIVLSNGPLDEKTARRYFRQIISAVSYLHANSIVHRDLKIENILIDENGSVRILDFGLSNFFDQTRFLKTFCGSLYFAAPELLKGMKYIGPEVDIWSLGVVLFVLLHGRVPFDDAEISGLHDKIKNADFETGSKISDDACDLLRGMINKDISQRYTLKTIINSNYINIDYCTAINNFLPIRKPLLKCEDRLLKILSSVTCKQFPNIEIEVRSYVKICSAQNIDFDRDILARRPSICLYYLMMERVGNGNSVVRKATERELLMHNFVSFIQDKNIESERFFLGSVFTSESVDIVNNTNSRVNNINMSQMNEQNNIRNNELYRNEMTHPVIKLSVVKWIFTGISVTRIRCKSELRAWTLNLLRLISQVDIKERNYMCLIQESQHTKECRFKVSLYQNKIFGTFFLSATRISGDRKIYKSVCHRLSEAGKTA